MFLLFNSLNQYDTMKLKRNQYNNEISVYCSDPNDISVLSCRIPVYTFSNVLTFLLTNLVCANWLYIETKAACSVVGYLGLFHHSKQQ